MGTYYRLSPSLVDGQHWTVVKSRSEMIEAVREWADNCPPSAINEGEGFSVCIVEMDDDEVAALPDV